MKHPLTTSFFSLLFVLSGLLFVTNLFPSTAGALSGSDFQAGRIIDDSVFYNAQTMSVQQIQEFLNAKMPSCDTNGTQPYAGTTRAAYGASKGYPAPFVCLKDYSQNIPGVTNSGSSLCGGSITTGTKPASQIIYEVSIACGINPQVMLVLLQKEQSLVTDDWPWSSQYRSATGYGCPDTAPCDSEYYGFFNQVYQAAKAFKRYAANTDSYNYRANRNNNIYFNPNLSGCGSSNVFISNQATANLYIYTPYQPNQAALNNLYGSGDSCSAYGNRNFWRMFNDWFGSTQGASYSWQLTGQSAYTDASKTAFRDMGNLLPGDKTYVRFTARNTGNVTWSNSGANAVVVGTAGPQERASTFSPGSSWLSGTRPTGLQEATVAPGETGTFEFWMNAPSATGVRHERFNLLATGITWFNDVGLSFYTNTKPITYSWSLASQYVYTDATKTVGRDMANLRAGEKIYVGFTARNTGNVTWSNSGTNPLRVGTLAPIERTSMFAPGSGWLGSSRPGALQESSVAPGNIGTFVFWLTVPSNPGIYHERFGIVAEGRGWLNDVGLSYFSQILP
jgi:hypothetical protein